MDRITQNLLAEFLKVNELETVSVDKDFEKFCNFSIVSSEYLGTFDIQDVTVSGPSDTGLDGIAIIVNGSLVNSVTEVEDLITANNYLEVAFIFIQAKTSAHFDASEIGTFAFGVSDFFEDQPKLTRNEFIEEQAKIQKLIYDKSNLFRAGKLPVCKMYYVTTGKWNEKDTNLQARAGQAEEELARKQIFQRVSFNSLGADEIRNLYNATKAKVSKTIDFVRKVSLPAMHSVQQAYTGVLPASEYFRLITDDNGNLRKTIFTDNIRDFEGLDNDVNKQIADTLQSTSKYDLFGVLNNGITVVADKINAVGDRFTLENFQIVNGCQTSHVVFDCLRDIDEDRKNRIFIPIKLVACEDDEIVNQIVRSTNSQTAIKPEQLIASSNFQRRLEEYYRTYSSNGEGQRLYYERRSNQYVGNPDVEKSRIVDVRSQIKVAASMFLDQPHESGRYFGTVFELVTKGLLFAENHDPAPYYVIALCHYWLEFFFRNAIIERKWRNFRFHLLMITRYQIYSQKLDLNNTRQATDFSSSMIREWSTQTTALEAAKKAIHLLDETVSTKQYVFDQDLVKLSPLVDELKLQLHQ